MDENSPASNPSSVEISTPRPRRKWIALIGVAACLVLLGAGAVMTIWYLTRQREEPLEGELRVTIVKVTKGKQETFQFDEPNALPVREGDGMGLQVHYQQPAHTYLIWLDSQGNVTPLYPWNMDNIDVKDANMAPPHCIATKNIFNPITIGGTWKFAKGSGLETIILLARRTPLDAEVKLHALLGGIAPAKVSDPGEAAVLSLDKGATSATSLKAINRGTVDEARARDQALTAQLEKLREHFELIRVVRFAHADK